MSQPQNVIEETVICPHYCGQARRRGLVSNIHHAHDNVAVLVQDEENHDDDGTVRDNFMDNIFCNFCTTHKGFNRVLKVQPQTNIPYYNTD